MLIPYRTKNPPERFPYATLTLIILNVVIYFFTSTEHYFLRVNDSALEMFAVSHNTLNPWRLTTAMFLHANIEHIAGNMLFLWLFGGAVEGRLRPWKFLVVYFVAGWTGGLLSDLVLGATSPDTPSLGASGAIMGLAGAYLFMFPHSIICIAWAFAYRFGVADWQAWWVVLLYVGLDLLFAVIFRGADGVGHFAHLGGFGTGLLAVWLLRARRDSEEVSQAQATLAETNRDYTVLGYNELEAILQQPTENLNIVLAFCEKAGASSDPTRQQKCASYLQYYAPKLFSQSDPNRLGAILLALPAGTAGLPLAYYLRLGSRLEAISSNSLAVQIYRRIYDIAPMTQDNEMALYRTAHLMRTAFNNRAHAQAAYQEMLRLFPYGEMALQAKQALQQIS